MRAGPIGRGSTGLLTPSGATSGRPLPTTPSGIASSSSLPAGMCSDTAAASRRPAVNAPQ
jgi:hypothetical protein